MQDGVTNPYSESEKELIDKISRLEDVLKRDPSSKVFAPLADAYRRMGLLDKAFKVVIKGLRIAPDYVSGRLALARIFIDKGMFSEARYELEFVLERSPDNIISLKLLKDIDKLRDERGFKDNNETEIRYKEDKETHINRDKREKNPFYTLTFASLLEQQGHYDEARRVYKTMLSRNPSQRHVILRRLERLDALS